MIPEVLALDTETRLIDYPDQVNPDLVVLSWAIGSESGLLHQQDPELLEQLINWLSLASEGKLLIVGANIAFDLWVLIKRFPSLKRLVWDAYQSRSIVDVQLVERLKQLSTIPNSEINTSGFKSVSLKALAEQYLNISMEGKDDLDAWRFNYYKLIDIRCADWPTEARDYAIKDAELTLQVYEAQRKTITPKGFGSANTQVLQAISAFILRKIAIDGIAMDQCHIQTLLKSETQKFEQAVSRLRACDLVDEYDKRNDKAIRAYVNAAYADAPTTETGRTKVDRKTLDLLTRGVTEDPNITALKDYSSHLKSVTTFLPQMNFPRIHPEFNVIVSTLRMSCRSSNYYKYFGQSFGKKVIRRGSPVPSINIQQIPRGSDFRKAFIPERGQVFIDADYSFLELVCFAQTCFNLFGYSDLGKAINAGYHPHDNTAWEIYKSSQSSSISFEDMSRLIQSGDKKAKECRRIAKIINLGIPGGQGKRRMLQAAIDSGLTATLADVEQWVSVAKGRYREFNDYFAWIRNQQYRETIVDGQVKPLFGISVCGVWLAEKSYTSAANGMGMQALGALGVKLAARKLFHACEIDNHNILYGSSLKAIIHDEFVISTDPTKLEDKMRTLASYMLLGLKKVIPDIRASCVVSAQDFWAKENTPGLPQKTFTWDNI